MAIAVIPRTECNRKKIMTLRHHRPRMGSQTSVAVGFKDNMVGVLLCLGHHKKLWHEAAVLRKDISISLVFVDQCFTVADKKNVAFFTSKKKLFRLNKSI